MENIGAYLVAKKRYEVRPAPMPELKDPRDVLVQIAYAGICAADQDMFLNGEYGIYEVDFPKIIGHEATGTVIGIGSAVTELKVGDRVALEPGVPCCACEQCLKGEYNNCPNVVFRGAPPVEGFYQKYVTHPARWCHRLPDNLSNRDGALIEPLAVGMESAKQGGVQMGDTVIILGLGTIGLCTLDCCRAKGATTIYAVDAGPTRLATAEHMGAIPIDMSRCDVVETIREKTNGRFCDVVFECSGSQKAFLQTVELVRMGGTVVGVGLNPAPTMQFDYRNMMFRGATLKFTNNYANVFPACVAGLSTGLLTTEGIITHEFPVEKVHEAFEFAIGNKTTAVKTIIKF